VVARTLARCGADVAVHFFKNAAGAAKLCGEISFKKALKFRHQVIDPNPPGAEHDITLIGDINGDGRPEIVIGGKQGPPNVFWYENPSWRRHDACDAPNLEAGGLLYDVNRDGRLDMIAGQQGVGKELYWFEIPADPTRPWTKRVIENRFNKYHDQAIGDVDGDGENELVFLSQKAGILAYYDIPANPRIEPWPASCFHLIAENTGDKLEGVRVVDIDGTGQNAILAGPNIFRRQPDGSWRMECYAPGFTMTRTAVGDLMGTGQLDIVIAEGESNPARLAICPAGNRQPILLREDLFYPHSLEIADFDGDGRLDIFVAEMGLGKNPDPKMFIFRNCGGGKFEEFVVQHGIPTHEAKVADLNGDGRPDIIGKPYHPERHIDVWFNES
jgi:hypothetical protein